MGFVKCSKCGNEFDEEYNCCPACGTIISTKKFCAVCGAELSDKMAFCPYCGTKRTENEKALYETEDAELNEKQELDEELENDSHLYEYKDLYHDAANVSTELKTSDAMPEYGTPDDRIHALLLEQKRQNELLQEQNDLLRQNAGKPQTIIYKKEKRSFNFFPLVAIVIIIIGLNMPFLKEESGWQPGEGKLTDWTKELKYMSSAENMIGYLDSSLSGENYSNKEDYASIRMEKAFILTLAVLFIAMIISIFKPMESVLGVITIAPLLLMIFLCTELSKDLEEQIGHHTEPGAGVYVLLFGFIVAFLCAVFDEQLRKDSKKNSVYN